MIGETILHYKILEKLGEGGMGVVYLAEDTKLKRKVAIKFLPHHISANKEERKRFEIEAQAAASLNHANIATIHSIEEADNQLFIVMEYIDGQELKTILRENKNTSLSIKETIDYSIQIVEGLAAAHEQGIIHRDIKAGNVMVTKDGNIKIMDFGLAKIGSGNEITQMGFTIGTVAFMSPEQTRGEQIDHRTDIWSFGIILYEMLTGHLPFKGDYDQAIIYSILNEDPTPVTQYSDTSPSALLKIVSKCLEKKPEDRYQTAKELFNDLVMYDADPDYGFKTKPVKIFPADKKKNLFRKIAFAGGLFALIIVLSFVLPPLWNDIQRLFGPEETKDEKHLLILPLVNVGGDPTKQAFCDGLMETLSSNLTQIEQFNGTLWVVPASEVIRNKITSAGEAYQMYGVNLAVTGSLQILNNLYRLTLNLVDAKNLRQLNSAVIDAGLTNIFSLQDKSVIKLLEMLHIELEPESRDILISGGTNVPEAYQFYVEGRGYLQRYENIENINAAINLFKLASDKDSLYALAYAGQGESYWRKYEATKNSSLVELAERECEKGFKLDSMLAPVNVTLGMIYSGTGRYDHAIDHFNRALLNDPSNAAAYRGLAKAYESQDKTNEAELTFKRAIKLKPGYWAGYNDLGVFYFKYGRYEEAIDEFKEVIKLTPDNYRGYNNLGGIYYMLERWGEAREMFEHSLSIRKSYNIYSNLGTLYYIEGKYEDAARTYELALELNNNDYLTWGNLAAAYHQIKGKQNKAIELYKHAISMAKEQLKINQSDPDVGSNLASYYADIGDTSNALKLIQRSLEIAPDNVQVMYRTATIFEQFGNREKAIYWINNAIKNGYSRSEIEHQPELKNLINDDRYRELFIDKNE